MTTTVLHVSPQGDDTATGSAERPFATPHRARAAVRALVAAGLRGPVRVVLGGGTYELAEPLDLGPEDSGSAEFPITWCAARGERAVLSGGRRLSGWTIGEHAGRACWTLDLPEVAAGTWDFQQLFVSELRRPRPRLPRNPRLDDGVLKLHAEDSYYRFATPADGKKPEPGTSGFRPGDLRADWRNPGDIKLVALRYWLDLHLWPSTIDERAGTVSFRASNRDPWSMGSLVDEQGHGARYWVENVWEAFDTPGQWYLDRPSGRLYYLPLPGETPSRTGVVAPRLPWLVRLLGSRDHGGPVVRHVRFEHLDFRHAEFTLPRENPGAGQAQMALPGAIVLRGAEDCAFYACSVAHVSQYAVEVRRNCRRNRVLACHLHDLGAGGVKLNHEGLHARQDTVGDKAFAGMEDIGDDWRGSPLPAGVAPGAATTVADCTIHAIGRLYPSACAVMIGDSARNRVLHNHIHDTYYTAISVGWTWGYKRNHTVDNRIEGNRIHQIGQAVLSDLGCIYLLGTQPGTTVRRNVVWDVRAHGYGDGGIYPDEGSSFMTFEENLVLSGGFGQHFGRDNLVRNNVFANGRGTQVGSTRAEPYRAFHFERNIVLAGGDAGVGANSARATFAGNLYWKRAGGEPGFPTPSFATWQAAGFDAGSRCADPLFVAPEGGDFTLRPDSPALAIGFVPFDPSLAGPRLRGALPATIDDLPPEPAAVPRPIAEARLEYGTAAEWFAGFSFDPDPQAANRYRYTDPSEPTAACLIVRSVGETRARGEIELVVSAPGSDAVAGRIIGPTRLAYDLAPGEDARLDFAFQLAPGVPRALIEGRARGEGVLPTALHAFTRPRITLPRLRAGLTLDGVAAALAGHRPLPQHATPAGIYELRVGWTGTDLAVHARVRDPFMHRGGAPWDGSDIEIFTAMPGTNGRVDGEGEGRRGNAQVFLIPAVGDRADTTAHMPAGVEPAPDVRMRSARAPDGYELSALIPPSFSRLTPGANRFLFEAVVRAVPVGETRRGHYSLFGDANGNDNGAWAMADIVG